MGRQLRQKIIPGERLPSRVLPIKILIQGFNLERTGPGPWGASWLCSTSDKDMGVACGH